MPCEEEKGLFPGRGMPLPDLGRSGGATGDSAGAGATGAAASGAGSRAGVGSGAFCVGGAGFSSFATGTTPSSANAAFSLRTTGGSIVEEGPLTNSPISFSFSRVRFESIPNSAAISCTRAFPATILLSERTQPGRAATYRRDSFRATHEVSICHSTCSIRVQRPGDFCQSGEIQRSALLQRPRPRPLGLGGLDAVSPTVHPRTPASFSGPPIYDDPVVSRYTPHKVRGGVYRVTTQAPPGDCHLTPLEPPPRPTRPRRLGLHHRIGLDIDLRPGQFRRQSGVLALFSDGE
jgi:hypothetical protein